MRSSPSPVNVLGDGTLIQSLGRGSGTGGDAATEPPAPSPWSDMSSESLLLLELSGMAPGAATGAFLNHLSPGDTGNPGGMTVSALSSSVAKSARSHCALSVARCLAASCIENCSFAAALTNSPCSSLALLG